MTEWISVKDELPPFKTSFLGTDGGLIFASYWCEDSDRYKVGGWESCYYCGGSSPVGFIEDFFCSKIITHWMPLPEPPKDL